MSGATECEERRLRAWDLKSKGWQQRQIAKALGVTAGAVSTWLKRARDGGVEALRARKRGGSQALLAAQQRARLPDLLRPGAKAFGFEDDEWTLPRITEVIRREFGVQHHPAHVSRILRGCGWNWQTGKGWVPPTQLAPAPPLPAGAARA